MDDRSHGFTPWIVLLFGVLLLMLGVLAWMSLSGAFGSSAGDALRLDLQPPPIPDAPRLPNAPVPRPQ